MKIGVHIYVTPRKAITIESSDLNTPVECMQEIEYAIHHVKVAQVKDDLISIFGEDC